MALNLLVILTEETEVVVQVQVVAHKMVKPTILREDLAITVLEEMAARLGILARQVQMEPRLLMRQMAAAEDREGRMAARDRRGQMARLDRLEQ